MDMNLIKAIAKAAEQHGGMSGINMLSGRTRWRDCVVGNGLWYDFPVPGCKYPSTGFIDFNKL